MTGEWGIRRVDFGDMLGTRWLRELESDTVAWTTNVNLALRFATRREASQLAEDEAVVAVGGYAEKFPDGGKTVDNPRSRSKTQGKPVDNSPCAWCGRPLHWKPSAKGGRPRVRHEECVAVANALTLLERAVDAQAAARLLPIPSEAKVLRRDVIGLAWRMAPGKLGASSGRPDVRDGEE